MLLKALADYYEILLKEGKVTEPEWCKAKVKFTLKIDNHGNLVNITRLSEKKEKKVSLKEMTVPKQNQRTSGKNPNFLCDNAKYFLGIDETKKSKAKERFELSKELHMKLLKKANSPVAEAVMQFFRKWNCEQAEENPFVKQYKHELYKGGNIVFSVNGKYAHDDEILKKVWLEYYKEKPKTPQITCMITGKKDFLAEKHPYIHGVKNTNTNGALLVSFNKESFRSYGCGNGTGTNVPIGQHTAMAYATALNYLIKTGHSVSMGDTTVVFFPSNGDDSYRNVFDGFMFGNQKEKGDDRLIDTIKKVYQGKLVTYDNKVIDPDMNFYVIGLRGNQARIAVEFFYECSFLEFSKNIAEHYNNLKISGQRNDIIPLWTIVAEICKDDKKTAARIYDELVNSVVSGTDYPIELIEKMSERISVEHKMNSTRAAIIKAYCLKNGKTQIPKEVLTVALNRETKNIPYNLGRLFAVYEKKQKDWDSNVNTTITDRYFEQAYTDPFAVYPELVKLAQIYEGNLKEEKIEFYRKLESEIFSLIDYPELCEKKSEFFGDEQQMAWVLGLQHQRNELYGYR